MSELLNTLMQKADIATHALISPSASSRWRKRGGCPGSIRMSVGIPRKSSPAARLGTAKHYVSGNALAAGVPDVSMYMGQKVLFVSEVDDPTQEVEVLESHIDRNSFIVQAEIVIDQDFIDHCNMYITFVMEQVALTGGELHVEVKVPIDHITGEKGATGTSDAVIWCPPQVIVIDAKFGTGRVNAYEVVSPAVLDEDGNVIEAPVVEPNSQLAMYASGAIEKFDMFDEIKQVRMIIVQPALNHVSEFSMENV